MTGLVQCLLPGVLTGNAPFHHLLLEVAIVMSNTLPSLLLAALLYCCWRPHDVGAKLWRPGAVIAQTAFLGMLIKYTLGIRHGRAPSADCCLGYILSLDYSLPSVHAAVAVLLAAYVGEQYWRVLRPAEEAAEAAADVEADLEEAQATAPACSALLALPPPPDVSREEVQDARLRLMVVWLYVCCVCSARIALQLNSVLDVLLGLGLGAAAYYAARAVQSWLAADPKAAAVKND